ncbi:hypothetical protein PP304_gp156 [Gordonia phage Phendrix]|uniref:Uncharacterized protein n=2 Tax=Godonkavirus TaxID=2733178 RepID=A0A4D6E2E7_9CAUD|nr:hypothetical protein HOV33_gp159 [Gordonia phage GodonK]YP_010649211.1 hypothetical protein PP304_gp156 [Gordonia phage Phendrix]QBZ72797.1 hypothetical protein SEA_GODONK_209 [Gordonia phage GodonK]QDK02713.1 hypothetical protein SEA_PHENDRIX_197 [Gordonia phage Phendrix]
MTERPHYDVDLAEGEEAFDLDVDFEVKDGVVTLSFIVPLEDVDALFDDFFYKPDNILAVREAVVDQLQKRARELAAES